MAGKPSAPNPWVAALGGIAKTGFRMTINSAAGNRQVIATVAAQMYEDETGKEWEKCKEQAQWLLRAQSAFTALAKMVG